MSSMMRQFARRAINWSAYVHTRPVVVSSSLDASRLFSTKSMPPENTPYAKNAAAAGKDGSSMTHNIDRGLYDNLVRSNKVVVFMKGTPKSPRCGFSNAVVQIFRMHGVEYDAHDVLSNDELREGIKAYTDWPTIPQVFINGEFVGGCDILLEMHQNGELIEELNKAGIVSELLKLQNEVEEKEAKAQKELEKERNRNNKKQ